MMRFFVATRLHIFVALLFFVQFTYANQPEKDKEKSTPLLSAYFFGGGVGSAIGSTSEQDADGAFAVLTGGYNPPQSPWFWFADLYRMKFTGELGDTRVLTQFNPSAGYRFTGSPECCDVYFHAGLAFSNTEYENPSYDKTIDAMRLQAGAGVMGVLSKSTQNDKKVLWKFNVHAQQSPPITSDSANDIVDYVFHAALIYTFGPHPKPNTHTPKPLSVNMRSVQPANHQYVKELKQTTSRAVTIYFDKESFALTDSARKRLERFFANLLKSRFIKDRQIKGVAIIGYTDKTHVVGGKVGERYNLELAKRRTLTASQYLVQKGLPNQLIKHFWVGQRQPKIDLDTLDDLNFINRRVEVYVVTK